MNRNCADCLRKSECSTFDLVEATQCCDYVDNHTLNEEIVENMRKESIRLLENEVPNHTNIENLIKYLVDKSTIAFDGRMRPETLVNKEALRLAAVYLQDYYDLAKYIKSTST